MSAAETVNRIVDVFPPEQQGQVRSMYANAVMGVVAQRLLPTSDGKGRVAVHEIMCAIANIAQNPKIVIAFIPIGFTQCTGVGVKSKRDIKAHTEFSNGDFRP